MLSRQTVNEIIGICIDPSFLFFFGTARCYFVNLGDIFLLGELIYYVVKLFVEIINCSRTYK